MTEEASLNFRLRKIDETKNYVLDEMKHNNLLSEKYKETCNYLNYVEHLLTLVLTITVRVSISAFTSLVFVPVGITSSGVGINIYAVTAGIKNENAANENASVRKTKKKRLILLSNCAACGEKKSIFIRNKELHSFD